jgi:hypothetical protein
MSGTGARVAVAAVALLSLAVIGGASSAEADGGKATGAAFAFRVRASHGYRAMVYAASRRADGRGIAVISVTKSRPKRAPRMGIVTEGAVYAAPATVTTTEIKADLGALGGIDLAVSGSGATKLLPTHCGHGKPVRYEPPRFSGSFEFHGEEGFAEAVSSSPSQYTEFFSRLICAGPGTGELGGGQLPGARLSLDRQGSASRLRLQANQNHPGGPTRFEVSLSEKSGEVSIQRGITLWDKSSAFQFDHQLGSAMLAPPEPFSGEGTFSRTASSASWSGDLAIDLPGHSDVPLTGSGITATLVHACWQGEGAGSRADCGFR